jgi:hypothetical protein
MAKQLIPLKLQRPDNTFESIMAYHLNPDKYKLSDKQEKIRKRWAEVLTLRLNYMSRIQVANKLVEDYDICLAQAYNDISNSELLYGNVLKADKEGTRAILFEYAHKFYQRAVSSKDLKMQSKALELMSQFGGLNDTENAEFNPEKLENKEIKIVMDPKLQKMLFEMVSKGVADFNGLNVTDVSFEDVK